MAINETEAVNKFMERKNNSGCQSLFIWSFKDLQALVKDTWIKIKLTPLGGKEQLISITWNWIKKKEKKRD